MPRPLLDMTLLDFDYTHPSQICKTTEESTKREYAIPEENAAFYEMRKSIKKAIAFLYKSG